MRSIVAALLLLSSSATAAPSVARRIDVARPGPQRLDVDLTLLAGSHAGLRDLRIVDGGGNEVAYLLVEPRGGKPEWARTSRLPTANTKTTSGAELDAGSIRTIEAVRIGGIDSPFLKRVRIEGSGDRQRWTVLADTTVFDLPHQKLERTVVEFAPVDVRYVRLTWDDTSSARVGGGEVVELRAHASGGAPRPMRVALPVRQRPSEPQRSRYRVQLPAAGLPIQAIELEVRGDVFRKVTVTEPRLGDGEIHPFELGSREVRQASRDGLTASDTRIPITTPRSAELDLVVEDGDNAPLDLDRLTIELEPQPWIYFEAAAAGAHVARYGEAGASAPRYDLEAARKLIDDAETAQATWGPAKGTRDSQSAEAPPLPLEGAKLDRTKFAVARTIAPAGRGMSTLSLDADVLARSRDLADVRLIDASGRQVPFVVERRDEPLEIPLALGARREDEGNVSAYALTLPYATLPPGSRIVLTTNARVFERQVSLHAGLDEGRNQQVIGQSTWRHADQDRNAPPLRFALPTRGDRRLELRVVEGDNAPLPISSVKLLMPAHALRFHHPGSALTLVYGNAETAPPRYDLALLAPRLFREPAQQVFFATTMRPGATENEGVQRHFFWIAIGAVALLLMLLLARLLTGLTPSQN